MNKTIHHTKMIQIKIKYITGKWLVNGWLWSLFVSKVPWNSSWQFFRIIVRSHFGYTNI